MMRTTRRWNAKVKRDEVYICLVFLPFPFGRHSALRMFANKREHLSFTLAIIEEGGTARLSAFLASE